MIAKKIEEKLRKSINPEYLEVVDESLAHARHYAPAKSGQTHFLIKITASCLTTLSPLQRHKKIYEILNEEIKQIHAICIKFIKDIP